MPVLIKPSKYGTYILGNFVRGLPISPPHSLPIKQFIYHFDAFLLRDVTYINSSGLIWDTSTEVACSLSFTA